MRLRHLEIFHAVMRSGSVSGAASLLNLSQSAASKALAQAEHSLDLTLFKRVQGRLVRTREAEELFAQTTLLFAQADNVQRLARSLKRNPEAHLRIGCLPSLGLGLLPDVVKAFRKRYPGVSVEILSNNGDALAEQVFNREVDVGICFDMPVKQGLERIPVGQVRTVHLGSPAACVKDGPVRLQALDMSAWIGIGGSDPLAQRIREVCEQLQMPMPSPTIETRTYYIAAALAREGLGFALVDELTAKAVAHDLPARALDPPVAVDAVAIHASAAVRSLVFDGFISALQERFKPMA